MSNWPDGAQCAVFVSFDFDAETLWLSRDGANADRLATLSMGTYGANVGVPKLLELMRDLELCSTFFIPGWTAERHTAQCMAALEAGHEIAHHGYLHKWPDPAKPDEIEEEFFRGMQALRDTLGVVPSGYRSPGGESCTQLLQLLRDNGIRYASTFKDHYLPYRHRLGDGSRGVVELPTNPSMDDTAYGLSHLKTPKPFFGKDHVLGIWREEFRELYDWGGLFVLILHPQVSGRPIRLAILREFLTWTREFERVWYATGDEIARWFESNESAASGTGAAA